MKVTESDVSILIPSYNQPRFLEKTLSFSLCTNASEIIVSDDASCEDIKTVIQKFNDKRLKIYYQSKNLGNWPNHYFLLLKSSNPWIKFIQIDDELHNDWLKVMCDAVDTSTTVVSALPDYKNLATNEIFTEYTLNQPVYWDSDDYLQRMCIVGNELGRPSYTLYKKNALDLSPQAWRLDISADLIANVMCASKGSVVLLPPGYVTCGIHSNQEGALQSFSMMMKRHLNSILYLKKQKNSNIQKFADIYGFVGFIGMIRNFFGFVRSKKNPLYMTLLSDISNLFKILDTNRIIKNKNVIKAAVSWKYSNRLKDINQFFEIVK